MEDPVNLSITYLLTLTLFQAGSGIRFPGRYGQFLPIYSLGYINPLHDLVVHKIYSQVDILDFSSYRYHIKSLLKIFLAARGRWIRVVIDKKSYSKKIENSKILSKMYVMSIKRKLWTCRIQIQIEKVWFWKPSFIRFFTFLFKGVSVQNFFFFLIFKIFKNIFENRPQ